MPSALSFPDQARRLCLNVATRRIACTRFAAHSDQIVEIEIASKHNVYILICLSAMLSIWPSQLGTTRVVCAAARIQRTCLPINWVLS